MATTYNKIFITLVITGIICSECLARSIDNSGESKIAKNQLDKLLVLQRRETSPANFSRLVAMRLIYGVASLLGLRDRIGGVLNGAFVPPGADDDYSFDLDDDDDEDVEFFDI